MAAVPPRTPNANAALDRKSSVPLAGSIPTRAGRRQQQANRSRVSVHDIRSDVRGEHGDRFHGARGGRCVRRTRTRPIHRRGLPRRRAAPGKPSGRWNSPSARQRKTRSLVCDGPALGFSICRESTFASSRQTAASVLMPLPPLRSICDSAYALRQLSSSTCSRSRTRPVTSFGAWRDRLISKAVTVKTDTAASGRRNSFSTRLAAAGRAARSSTLVGLGFGSSVVGFMGWSDSADPSRTARASRGSLSERAIAIRTLAMSGLAHVGPPAVSATVRRHGGGYRNPGGRRPVPSSVRPLVAGREGGTRRRGWAPRLAIGRRLRYGTGEPAA